MSEENSKETSRLSSADEQEKGSAGTSAEQATSAGAGSGEAAESVSSDSANTTKTPDAGKKKMTRQQKRRIRKIITWVIVAALLGGGGIAFWRYRQQQKAAKEADSGVNTATVTRGDITQKISSTGTIAAKDTYSITALVTGTIVSADFEEGDQVKKGQVLYQIDVSSMASRVTSAENTLTRAKKKLAEAQQDYADAVAKYSGNVYTSTMSGYITAIDIADGQKIGNGTKLLELTDETKMSVQIPFLEGEADLMQVGDSATLTLSDTLEQITGTVSAVGDQIVVLSGGRLVRYVTVDVENPGGLTTTTPVSAAIDGFDCVEEGNFEANFTSSLEADLDGNVDCVQVLVHVGDYVSPGTPIFSITPKSAQDIIQDFDDAVDNAQSSVENAQQSLDSTNDTVNDYTITAPIDGEVITKSYKVGDKIGSNSGQSSSTTLATIYDMSAYTFDMSIDETDISDIKVGQTVEVTADAFGDETFSGKVTNISLESTVSNGVSTYPVEVTMDSTDKLLPGMNVNAEIIIASASDALVIPADALMRGNRVYVKDDSVTEADGAVPAGFRAVDVETGLVNDDYVQITSGDLSEGDTVYVQESSTSTTWTGPGGMGGMGGGPDGGGPGGGGQGGGGNRGGGGPM